MCLTCNRHTQVWVPWASNLSVLSHDVAPGESLPNFTSQVGTQGANVEQSEVIQLLRLQAHTCAHPSGLIS